MTMNPTADHLDDEFLSALLDGDTGAPGLPARAEAHLRACDRCAGRQRELAEARAALAGAPIEAVDELTRRRLVAAAVQAAVPAERARSRWATRHPALVGSAAAVILALLVGVPFVLDNGSPSRDAGSTLAAGAPGAAEFASPFLGDLGELSDRESLRLRLTRGGQVADDFGYRAPMEPGGSPAAGAREATPAASPAPVAGGLASTTTMAAPQSPTGAKRSSGGGSNGFAEKATADSAADGASSNATSSSADAGRDRADTDACATALLDGPARGGRLTASGTGTYDGRPAIVAVFDLSGGRIAFVADRSGCVVLDQFSV